MCVRDRLVSERERETDRQTDRQRDRGEFGDRYRRKANASVRARSL